MSQKIQNGYYSQNVYKTPLKYAQKAPKRPPAGAYRGSFCQKKFTGKEQDRETGLYYYGARYLDPKTSRWLSGDPAMGDYIPGAPVNDEAKKRNGNLPGQGGVFNYVNLHTYHYAGNNPVKYTDPDGESPILALVALAVAVVGLLQSDSTKTPSTVVDHNAIQKFANAAKNPMVGVGMEFGKEALKDIGQAGAGNAVGGVGNVLSGISILSDSMNLLDVINDPNSTMPDYADKISNLVISGIGAAGPGGAAVSAELSLTKRAVVVGGKAVADINSRPLEYVNKMSEWATGSSLFEF